MSEESGAPKPSKLKLSSSKSQPEKQASTPTPSTNVSPVSLKPKLRPQEPLKADEPKPQAAAPEPVQAPASTSTPAPLPSPTPPPLTKRSIPPATQAEPQRAASAVPPPSTTPPKSNPLGSILIVAALLLILAAASGGIWYIISSDQTATDASEEVSLEASPSNPIERAKATIATVPDRTLDHVYAVDPKQITQKQENSPEVTEEPPQVTEPSAQVAPEPTPPTTNTTTKAAVSEYLQHLHIGGVRTGERARIMLDGKNYNINDTVDPSTGLKFIGTRDQKLLFKDSDGIIYVKSF